MITHCLNKIYAERNMYYTYSDGDTLSDYALKEIESLHKVDEIWYWYQSGSYDGDGEMFLRKGDKYASSSLSHCSCYGPTEHLPKDTEYVSLEELEKQYSINKEYYKNVEYFFEIIKKNKQ